MEQSKVLECLCSYWRMEIVNTFLWFLVLNGCLIKHQSTDMLEILDEEDFKYKARHEKWFERNGEIMNNAQTNYSFELGTNLPFSL